jgi:hypothetical protein
MTDFEVLFLDHACGGALPLTRVIGMVDGVLLHR